MCTYQLADGTVQAVRSGRFDVVLVGIPELALTVETGDVRDRVWAMEAVDQALDDLSRVATEVGASLVLAASPPLGESTAGPETGWCLIRAATGVPGEIPGGGAWIDVAPTLLALLGLEPPPGMEGRSLLR
jgi:2,3-bisphosphoglycerate-independent phosphoglycerate mutase